MFLDFPDFRGWIFFVSSPIFNHFLRFFPDYVARGGYIQYENNTKIQECDTLDQRKTED